MEPFMGYNPFGMSMPGRSLSLSNYRFGFNGQEKTDEISGLGNHNNALYWEYDTRLGRRWNVDPVKKSWQSDYSCFSFNPIWRVDPDGDDDFFNTDGSLSHRTKSGTRIIIQTKEGSKTFSQVSTQSMHNRQTLANITSFYAGLVGIKGMVGIANHPDVKDKDGSVNKHTSDNTLAYTTGNEIYVNAKGGGINPLLDDYNNLENTLIHEKDHKAKGQGFKDINHLEHAEVYLTAMQNQTFAKTTGEFQAGAIGSLIDELRKAAIADQRQDSEIKSAIDKANIALEKTGYKISFERTSMDSYGIEINLYKDKKVQKNYK